jgi:hypothetical protein
MDLDDDYADPGHSTGVTEEGYIKIDQALSELGTSIDVRREDAL